MSSPVPAARFKPSAVPLAVCLVVAVAVLAVPPLVLGEATTRTYVIAAAVTVLAVGSVFPYALFVALGTLPLLYAGVTSFAAPETGTDAVHPFSTGAAIRHVAAGVSYVLGAAVVGAVGIGAQMAVESGSTAVPAAVRPLFLHFGGVLVASAFVSLHLWRYDTPPGELPRRTVLGTAALGGLLALSPAVAFWVFNGAGF